MAHFLNSCIIQLLPRPLTLFVMSVTNLARIMGIGIDQMIYMASKRTLGRC